MKLSLRVLIACALLSAVILMQACSSSSKKIVQQSKDGVPGEQREYNLTEEYAIKRSKVINSVAYGLNIFLDKESEEFKGQAQIEFNLTEIPSDLHLDFHGGRIAQYSINNKDIEDIQHRDGRLIIPAKYLIVGSNHVVVHYAHPYSKDGRGFYRFKDQEDGNVYLWTQFEAFYANKFMPCFDQPDLKATLRMTVTAPEDWEVVTTTMQERIQKVGKKKVWSFPETPIMSTYLFSLHAGPYKVWTAKAGKVPLRLFARQTMAKYVRVDHWFKITQQGLKFFDSYFDYPYPFKKYDQLIIPDFNSGAMENIGAVTFSERYLKRGQETREDRENIANVLMHEMAHMWFGNLVTMKWWNGLWLNESFATYMGYFALVKATEFKEAWVSFQNGSKAWAYEEDQLVTTHPIESKIPDVESTYNNFDGITYGKGAAVMKQLAFYIGEDNFRDGLRLYFKKHQYQNTSIEDFLGSLQQASKKNLTEWAKTWLEKKGLDSAELQFKCSADKENSKIESASIKLTPPEAEYANRTHATLVGLYDLKDGKVIQRKLVQVDYSGSNTDLPMLKGEKCPDFAYLNAEDYDYIKPALDQRSLATVKGHIAGIQDRLLRQMVWNNLFQMVKDRKLTVSAYLDLLLNNLPKEKDVLIVQQNLYYLGEVAYYLPKSTEEEVKFRAASIAKIEKLCLSQFMKAVPGSDLQKNWFDALVMTSESPAMLAKLTDLFLGKTKVSGFVLDQDRRWSVIRRLAAFSAPRAQELLTKEKAKDRTENGVRSSLAAEVARPDGAVKFHLINNVIAKNSELSFSRKRSIVRSAFPINQDEFRQQYANEYYKTLLQLVKEGRDSSFLMLYTGLTPTTCDEKSLGQISDFLDKNSSKLVPSVLKPLRIAKQEEERCIEIRKTALLK